MQKNMGGIYRMLNQRIKYAVLSCEVIFPSKTYGKYVSRHQHTKDDDYVIQYEDDSEK